MIFSGIDLVEIERIEKSLKNPRFLEKYFGEAERAELEKKNFKPESVAACFAAKEALLIRHPISHFITMKYSNLDVFLVGAFAVRFHASLLSLVLRRYTACGVPSASIGFMI